MSSLGQGSEPSINYVDASNCSPPSGTKLAVDTDCSISSYPVLLWGNYIFWPLSYIDNRLSLAIVQTNTAGATIRTVEATGARYINNIQIDTANKRVSFVGQAGMVASLSWSILFGTRVLNNLGQFAPQLQSAAAPVVVKNDDTEPSCPPSHRHEFEVGIICALETEFNAVTPLFDQYWDEDGDRYGRISGDQNTYTTGRIGKYNVVLALLPGMGKANAAGAAANFRSSYRGVQLALLVGICGAVPKNAEGKEILLGDVVISQYVIQYDFGRRLPDKFKRKDTLQDSLGRANADIRAFVATLRTRRFLHLLQSRMLHHLKHLQMKVDDGEYEPPDIAEDRLFQPAYRHKHSEDQNCQICNQCTGKSDPVCEEALDSTCIKLKCDESQLVPRQRLAGIKDNQNSGNVHKPAIHFGPIASGDTVMKSGEDRDMIAAIDNIIAFEMEGAGVWDNMPCIIIKGVCDYADCHKNKKWQHYASATAASTMKAVLERYIRTDKR
ncbi:purine and uridine phosphorylase [Aspergillus novofumigatus IBT 16806]|uniref:Purine and uridine phosphorylase n=1 Tax=Aspergillus novofumigatus (strain IBT 16806) TaxID=1392255 RepID=A0A2I1CPD7_ASPN1|nr:purine and uridine phosphorylase [Aspergillus novofumigatus IBT 16806]PKX99487.1 purine and uridine phosphorylase [Aspergillus novofumigatus IBT 16806]